MSNLAARITFIAGLTASLVLTGCGGSKPTGHAQAPPKNTTENAATNETDPVVLAHMNARKQVDPNEINGPHRYTTTPTAEEIDKDTNIRVVRLENQLADLQSDFKKLQPNLSPEAAKALEAEAKQTLAQVEMEKQALMTQAEQQTAMAEQIIHTEEDAPEVIAPAAGTPTQAISNISGVRVGEHPDKTRIVLDVSAPAKFSYNIDNAENLLTIDLPESSWSGAMQESLSTSSMIKGYTAQPSPTGGTAVTIELKRPAKMTMGSLLDPNEVYGYRMVFDVAPL